MRYILPLLPVWLWLSGCEAPPPAPEPTAVPSVRPTPVKKSPQERMTEAGKAIFQTKKGKRWLMEAFNVRYNDGKQQAQLDNVDWTLSDDNGQKRIRITAPRAVYRMEREQVEFQGPVEARRYDTREWLKASHLVWEGKTGVLRGSQGVKWVKGVTTVSGDTATTTDKLDHIVVEGHVKVTTRLEEDPFDPRG